jgi:hypothetical protein
VGEDRIRQAVESQVDWWWTRLFRPRLEGLTDDELWWVPVERAWTLHRADDGAFHYEWPPGSVGESPPPFTAMSWRLCHLTLPCLAGWSLSYEGAADPAEQVAAMTFPEGAHDAVALVEHWWARWRQGLAALRDEQLLAPIGATAFTVDAPVMRLGRGDPLLHHVLHQHRELIHHGAEVNLLRDLYRSRWV